MARYIDGHTPGRVSNPSAGDVVVTVAILGAVVIGGIVLIRFLGESAGQAGRDVVRSLPIPEGLKPTEYPLVPGSMFMDATGRWCWVEQMPDGTQITKCASQPGFDVWW